MSRPANAFLGSWRLVFVAMPGESSQRRAEGTLRLWARDSADHRRPASPYFTTPVGGSTDVNFALLRVVLPGDPASRSPVSPGVTIREYRSLDSPPRVTSRLRFGQDTVPANSAPPGYQILDVEVTEWRTGYFGGTWRNGRKGETNDTVSAWGYFCARRA